MELMPVIQGPLATQTVVQQAQAEPPVQQVVAVQVAEPFEFCHH
jgi:hypothetical protein